MRFPLSSTPPMQHKECNHGGATRERLLAHGARLFAERGYEITNLRDVSAAARANLCAVKYYFGDKAAFYQECVRHVWKQHHSPLAAVRLDEIRTTESWRRIVEEVAFQSAKIILNPSPNQHLLNQIMCREMSKPTPALNLITGEFIKPRVARFEKLLALGMPSGTPHREVRLRAFLVIAQIMAFASNAPMVDMLFGPARHSPRFLRALAQQVASSVTHDGRLNRGSNRR